MVIFIPNIARCSEIALIFTLNFCDNFSLSNLMVSWIYILVDLTEQPISGHWNISEGCFESFFQVRNHLPQIGVSYLTVVVTFIMNVSGHIWPEKKNLHFYALLFLLRRISHQLKSNTNINLTLRNEVSIEQIILISYLLKFLLMWYSQ